MTLTKHQREALRDPFPIIAVSRHDIKERFSLTDEQALNIDDDNMARLATELFEAYCDRIYWIDLDMLAEDIVRDVKV